MCLFIALFIHSVVYKAKDLCKLLCFLKCTVVAVYIQFFSLLFFFCTYTVWVYWQL